MNNSDDLDPRLQQLYRQLVKEQPSPELDAKILAAAQQAIKKPSRWFVPVSMAASVVMVGSLVLYWTKQPETLQQNLSVSSAQEKIVAEPKAAVPAPTNDIFSGVGGSSSPSLQTEIAKPQATAKPSAAMATDEQMPEKLKDLRSEPHQNRVVNQTKEIKEEVANISSTPKSVIAKQDNFEGQASDNLSSINQSMTAYRVMQKQRSLATAQRTESVGLMAKYKAQSEQTEVALLPTSRLKEIERVFVQHDLTLKSVYLRELSNYPNMKGKLSLKLTVTETGKVNHCEVILSDLNNNKLESQIVALVKDFDFGAGEVWQGEFSIDFYQNQTAPR